MRQRAFEVVGALSKVITAITEELDRIARKLLPTPLCDRCDPLLPGLCSSADSLLHRGPILLLLGSQLQRGLDDLDSQIGQRIPIRDLVRLALAVS